MEAEIHLVYTDHETNQQRREIYKVLSLNMTTTRQMSPIYALGGPGQISYIPVLHQNKVEFTGQAELWHSQCVDLKQDSNERIPDVHHSNRLDNIEIE